VIVKPGYKTTELLAAILASVSSWLFEWQGSLSPKYAAYVSAIAAAAYAISRGLTKLGAYLGAAKATPPVVAPNAAVESPIPPAGNVEGV
jgi:hypothetical protein